jgi:hypothetical protein
MMIVIFFWQTTNCGTWLLKTANQVGNPGQAVFTAGHPQYLLSHFLPTITDIEYDLPVIKYPDSE